MYTSFGYFEDPADDRKVLDNVYRSLAPGGVLLMDFLGRDGIITHFQRRDWREVDGAYLLEDREFIDDCARMKNRWIIIRDGQIRETGFVLRLYGAPELTRLIRETGFVSVRTYADLAGNPFTHRSPRLVIVAEKEPVPAL
jgi:SAM-dependent methyltransferase